MRCPIGKADRQSVRLEKAIGHANLVSFSYHAKRHNVLGHIVSGHNVPGLGEGILVASGETRFFEGPRRPDFLRDLSGFC